MNFYLLSESNRNGCIHTHIHMNMICSVLVCCAGPLVAPVAVKGELDVVLSESLLILSWLVEFSSGLLQREQERVWKRERGEKERKKENGRNNKKTELGLPPLPIVFFFQSPPAKDHRPASPPAKKISGPQVTWLTKLILNLPCRLALSDSQPL